MKGLSFCRARYVCAVIIVVLGSFTFTSGQGAVAALEEVRQTQRLLLAAINGKYYMAKYEDLCKAFDANDAPAIQHYSDFGKKEGRQPSPFFDAKFYIANYPDLKTAFGSDYVAAFNHWISYGIKEGRAGSKEFDPKWYLKKYPDLVTAYGPSGYRAAILHFAEYGIREKRQGAETFNYATSGEPEKRCYGTPFAMIIASDTQYARTEVLTSAAAAPVPVSDWSKDQIYAQSEKDNKALIAAMNLVAGEAATNVKGVIINGDLTEHGHPDQLAKFKEMYGGTNVKVPLYLGLGNHDYTNNVDDCYLNGCASRMVDFMAEHVSRLPTKANSFDYSASDKSGSLAYSWDMGNVHFVQLQGQPGYTREWSINLVVKSSIAYRIKSSMEWLKRDLSEARLRNKYIIINMHDATQVFPADFRAAYNEFKALAREFKVSAVFGGHIHHISGGQGDAIGAPIFLSGAANYRTFLVARFVNGTLTVEKASTYNHRDRPFNKVPLL